MCCRLSPGAAPPAAQFTADESAAWPAGQPCCGSLTARRDPAVRRPGGEPHSLQRLHGMQPGRRPVQHRSVHRYRLVRAGCLPARVRLWIGSGRKLRLLPSGGPVSTPNQACSSFVARRSRFNIARSRAARRVCLHLAYLPTGRPPTPGPPP
jgi:hypothetical protein